jgi:catechol 2,3-dioxygenase-like lactoylglutathione lyase family enzyme
MKARSLNHVALYIEDVDRSRRFYEDVLGLEPIERPAFDFPGAWYRLGVDQELHLISGRRQDPQVRSGANHYALLVDDMDAAESLLRERGCDPGTRRVRPDGAFQIYVRDPDGHTIEICTAPAAA